MIYQLQIPDLFSEDQEVRMLEWHSEIDRVFEPNELLVEFETDKAVVEVRADRRGYLRVIMCEEGQWARSGTPLAVCSDTIDEPLPVDVSSVQPLPVALEFI